MGNSSGRRRNMGFWCIIIIVWGLLGSGSGNEVPNGKNVSYDGRSLIINDHHELLFSGSIHYPRSTPQMWPYLIKKAKEGGLDVIQTYVFWNIHEPQQGQFDFSGRHDLIRFIKEVQSQGLYVCLRLGPFIEAEWNYGGLPFWLHDVPDIVFRSDNKPFKKHMQRYSEMIVGMMKRENLYASQGGPIILTQIENEYGTYEGAYKEEGKTYIHWAAKMAVSLETGVPWIMCKQDDAPDPVINTCNGMRCGETFSGPNSPHKPSMWTENWTSFYQTYGEEAPLRSAEDIAYQVALFIAKKGCYVNYYMYHGGTNFGRTSARYMLTGYYDQAPLDEYGLPREPKWSHLKELHAAIKLCKKPLLYGTMTNFTLGQFQQAYVFKEEHYSSGKCAAFLVNSHKRHNATVFFKDTSYFLPKESITILPDCNTVALNTAQVNAQYNTRSMETRQKLSSYKKWEKYSEPVPMFAETTLRAQNLLEQMNTTKDSSDYLWYTFRFERESTNTRSVLKVETRGHVLHAFVNNRLIGSAHGSIETSHFTLKETFDLSTEQNHISLLSVMVGLPDSGAFLEKQVSGLRGLKVNNRSLDHHPSGYQVGLVGERLKVYTNTGSRNVQWDRYSSSDHQPLTWYKAHFITPPGYEPVALNLGSMGKGEAWVNGQRIGRYWVSFLTPKDKASQQWYNVPRSFLKPSGKNSLVLLEEETKTNPLEISIDIVAITKVCGHVLDLYPPIATSLLPKAEEGGKKSWIRKVHLSCHEGQRRMISRVLFASYGTPLGDCGGKSNGTVGTCHSPNSESVVQKACVGKGNCSISLSPMEFGGDPCLGIPKSLLVVAQCN